MVGSERLPQFSRRLLKIRTRSGSHRLRAPGRGKTHPRRPAAGTLLAVCVRAQGPFPQFVSQHVRVSGMSDRRQLSLNLFIYPGGHHEAAWRYKDSAAERILDVSYYQELARRAEAHKFDAIFFADGPALADNVRYAQRFRLEPITWLSAIAAVTSRIGLIATASTTYMEPYNLARLFASLDHVGKHFRVRGPLNISRPPQGRPVYVQAGSSEDGRAFAARFAEAIFTAHQTLASAQEFYADIKRQAKAFDRHPDQIKVLPGISPFIGSTQVEADRLQDEFNELIQPEYSLTQLRQMIGLDLSGFDLDGPFPRHLIDTESARGVASRFKLVVDIVDREKQTIRQLVQRLAGARGHWVIAGPPEKIADNIQTWFEGGAADGFNVMPPWLPGGFDAFAEQVVPILRRRGLFRDDYDGKTLRDQYGLVRPTSEFAGSIQAIA